MYGNSWTTEELDILKTAFNEGSSDEVANKLIPNHSINSICAQRSKLGLVRYNINRNRKRLHQRWTPDELNFVKIHKEKGKSNSWIGKKISRSTSSINSCCWKLSQSSSRKPGVVEEHISYNDCEVTLKMSESHLMKLIPLVRKHGIPISIHPNM